MAVTRATIRTSSWDAVYNLLQTGTYAISTNNIFSAFNSQLIEDKGYPVVIINSPSASINKETVTGLKTNSDVMIAISIYHNSAQNVKALTDEVTNSLLSGRTVLAGNGLKNMNIGEGVSDSWQEGGKKKHRIDLIVSFRFISQ